MIDSFPVLPTAKKARVEIIPLIDVVFFLLATFVLFTLCLARLGNLDVSLPRPGEPPKIDLTLYVRADARGVFTIKEGNDGVERTVGSDGLRSALQQYQATHVPARLLVSGANDAPFGATVDVFDAALGAGITDMAINMAR